MHPTCHSQPSLRHPLTDSCQSCLVGADHDLDIGFLPVQSCPGGFSQGIP